MAMKMNRAFSRKFITKHIATVESPGAYDANNDWIEGATTPHTFWGVNIAGNKFSQLEEGESRKPTAGGERFSDWRSLYVQDRWPEMSINDKVTFRGKLYNILQKSDEKSFGFWSYLLEAPKQ